MQVYQYHLTQNTYKDSQDIIAWENNGIMVQVNSLSDLPLPPEGFEWREGNPEGIKRYEPDNINSINDQLESLYMSLKPDERAQFYTIKAGVKEAILKQDYEAAGFIIMSITVSPNLETIKDGMLEILGLAAQKHNFIPPDFNKDAAINLKDDTLTWWQRLLQSIQAYFNGGN